jgi:hypothetical protein
MPDPQTAAPTPQAPPQTLAKMVRAKYPTEYSDMDDSTLEKNWLAKYPQYSDVPRTGQTPGAGQITGIGIDPASKTFSLPWFKRQGQAAASGLADALPAIGGTLGAMAGTPQGGPVGSIGGAGLGTMGGAAGRQLLRRWMGFGDAPNTPEQAASDITKQGVQGAILQGGGEGAGALLKRAAPSMAESALNVTERMRGRGRTIGQSALDETTGVRPATIRAQAGDQLGRLTSQMENSVHQATSQGAMGSTAPAQQALNDTFDSLPRNARALRAKVLGLGDLLDLRPQGSIGPVTTAYTPDELLEMKRGIGKEIQSWPPEWQKMPEVKGVQTRLYGALDNELDRLVPGNADMNQRISSLIPVQKQATRLGDQAPLGQRLAHRAAAHTGALAGTGIGGYLGSQEGNTPAERRKNALLGAAAGFVLPELATTPTAQMTMARGMNAAPQGISAMLPFLRVLASQPARKPQNDEQQQ